MKKRHLHVVAIILAVLGGLAAVSAQELDFTPGWTDATFDGSDHQTSGIDVYIPNQDWGSIPMPSGPVPVDPSEYAEKTTPDLGDLVEIPDPHATETSAAASSRFLAIQYRDSAVQVVHLRQEFRHVARIRTWTAGDRRTVAASFTGRWNSRELGRITISRRENAWTGSTSRGGLRFEGVLSGTTMLEGTWCDSSRRSGRVLLQLGSNAQTLTVVRYQGLDRPLPTVAARRQ